MEEIMQWYYVETLSLVKSFFYKTFVPVYLLIMICDFAFLSLEIVYNLNRTFIFSFFHLFVGPFISV